MEKYRNSCDKEFMKRAMLKQEEMFREQVYELHRLYRVQKILMKNIPRNRGNEQNEDGWIKSKDENFHNYDNNSHHIYQPPRQRLDLEQSVEEHIAKLDDNCVQMENECEIELTLGLPSYNLTRKAKTLQTSNSGVSFSSSSTGSSGITRKGNSGRIRDKSKDELTADNCGVVEVSNLSPSFLNSRRNSTSDMNGELKQGRVQQSPWSFQVLSMNIT